MEFKANDTVVTHVNRESRNAGTVGVGSVGVVTVVGIELQDGLEDGSCSGIEVVFDGGRVYAEYKPSELSHAAGNPITPEDAAKTLKEDRPAELKKFRTGDPQAVAVALVNALYYKGELPSEDVYIVWFCAALQNWKALVSTNVKDNSYYEVTHNGDKNETYVDKYVKHDHYTIPDSFLQD